MSKKKTKMYILEKYKDDIILITDKVFNTWVKESLPLAMKIAQDEKMTLLEAKMLLDVLLVETIRDLADRHRITEKTAEEVMSV